ncbi:hypothetical protein FA13DRAFT_1728082 [Coprinellus micaceus]|uniref:DUF1857-domain-containing protein n=1 Tax=Coprinellus micaceus TaxID=71717 RepID=A0A4Y7TM72_COPMI|nr:hypothetical protein FA13DRAFT_1728082 [Coprinellus micaceus]
MSNFAASRKVNPEGSSVKLTAEQVWKGLQIKARDPAKFIPDTTSVNTISDAEDKLIREISFKGKPAVTQEISFHPNVGTNCSHKDKNTSVSNILSYDESNELVLTIQFVGGVPNQDPAPEASTPENLNKRVGQSVERTISQIRALVQDGTIA